MRVLRPLACIALLACTSLAYAQTPATRLIPSQADLVVQINQPRQLVETILHLDLVEQAQKLPPVQEVFESAQYRRFKHLITYYEKELGAPWPEILDKLAGDGAAAGFKFSGKAVPNILVAIQARDESALKQFIDLAVVVIEQELNRQEAKVKIEKAKFDGADVWSIGKDIHVARLGKQWFLSNNDKAIEKGIALAAGKEKKSIADDPDFIKGAKLLPKVPLVTVWGTLKEVHNRPEAKEFYKVPRDPTITAFVGQYVDVFSRSPFACASFGKDGDGFLTTIRLPAGRDGMGTDQILHLPEKGKTGTRPLLEPKGVIYSSTFFFDIAKIWEERVKIFGEEAAKQIEKAEAQTSKLPIGNLKLSKVLMAAGPYHRIVVAQQDKRPYKKTPKTLLPAFAFITEMRDADGFSRAVEAGLRTAALFAGGQVGLELAEEKYKDVQLVAYRFKETTEVKQDIDDIRFNFTPCFVRVGNQFVICSTVDLCKELVDLLQSEAKQPETVSPATSLDKFYAGGVADILTAFEDQLAVQAVLDQAVPLDEARQQVKGFIALVRGMGSLSQELIIESKMSRYDIRAKAKK